MGVQSELSVVWICISLMMSNTGPVFHGPVGYLDIFGEISIQVTLSFYCWVLRVLSVFWLLDPYQVT